MSFIGHGTGILLNPPVERRMINEDVALGHDLFEIAVRNWKTSVKINGVKDHRFWVLRALETDPLIHPDVGLTEADLIDCNCLRGNDSQKLCDTTIEYF